MDLTEPTVIIQSIWHGGIQGTADSITLDKADLLLMTCKQTVSNSMWTTWAVPLDLFEDDERLAPKDNHAQAASRFVGLGLRRHVQHTPPGSTAAEFAE